MSVLGNCRYCRKPTTNVMWTHPECLATPDRADRPDVMTVKNAVMALPTKPDVLRVGPLVKRLDVLNAIDAAYRDTTPDRESSRYGRRADLRAAAERVVDADLRAQSDDPSVAEDGEDDMSDALDALRAALTPSPAREAKEES